MQIAEANPRNNSYEGDHIGPDNFDYNSYEGDYGRAHGHKDMKHVGQGVGLTLRPSSHHNPSPGDVSRGRRRRSALGT